MVWFGRWLALVFMHAQNLSCNVTHTLASLGISTIDLRCFFPHSLLILVYGFLTAIGEDYEEGGNDSDVWPGSAFVGAIMLAFVILIMSGSWIRGKCCPPKLQYGARKAR